MCHTKLAASPTAALLPSVCLPRLTGGGGLGLFSHSCLSSLGGPPQDCEGEATGGKEGLPRVRASHAMDIMDGNASAQLYVRLQS